MLKTRILTISVLLPVVLLTLLYGSTTLVDVASAIIFLLAGWEWTNLIGIKKTWVKAINLGIIISICAGAKYFNLPVLAVCFVALLWWIEGLWAIIVYPCGTRFWKNSWIGSLVGCFLFVPVWLAIDWLHGDPNFGPVWLAFLCFLVWGADVGAYVFGKKWGKKKLLPKVSPGKTWVGVVGAFLFAFIVVLLFASFWLCHTKFIVLCAIGVITVVFSIIGDLVESLFKRIRGCKDSGNLLPGHGGVLDRVDGLLAAIPMFVVGLKVFYT